MLVFSDFLNLFLFDAKRQLGTVIKALQTKGQFQILAEPNLVAESGKEASFLAGGEFPVPVAQGSGANLAISVVFKEFGVRLNFTPVINGDRIHLKVRPEVSTLDFANGVLLNGFRIPALSTRRTETELELQDGQTFAISGLLNNSLNSTLQKIPGIGDIPILGLLFKSKAANKEQTELVVMITPQILTRNSSGVTTALPKTPEPFLAPLPANKLVDPLPPAFTPARQGAALSPAAAAAVLTPAPPARVVVGPTTGTAPPATAAGAPASTRPLTGEEKKALERSRKQDEVRKAIEAKEQLKRDEADRRTEQAEQKRQAKLAAEQAKADAEAAKVAAEQAQQQARKDAEAAKAAAEKAKRRDEIERNHQKLLEEAAAKARAISAALGSPAGGQPVSVLPEDITLPNAPTGQPTGVAVHVFRTAARTNPVPTLMGTFFGVQQVDIDAIATAEASAANAMTCVKPFMIPDRWQEKNKPPNTTFDKYSNKAVLRTDADVYRNADYPIDQYTGYTTGKDVGTQLTLRAGTGDNINPSFYFSWKMPGDVGGDFYRDNIANCNQSVIIRGKKIIQEPGDKSGPTIQGIQALIDKDPLAHWDTGCKCVKGSAFAVSPRAFPIPLYDPEL